LRQLDIDADYLVGILRRLLETPSPSGYTDAVVRLVCAELKGLGIDYELTRRGAIRASLEGRRRSPDRAVIAHLDTLGAMVKALKENGRLALVPIGTWSARFAEGARVTVFRDSGSHARGTILPLKASGHVYNEEVDSQPVAWDNLEIRVDEINQGKDDLVRAGFNVGDFVAVDSAPEFSDSGFVNARHLDDKAGVAAMLAAAKAIVGAKAHLALDCHLLFTISEEVGVGASAVLHGDVAEIVSIDNGTIAPGQNTSEYGVTVVMQDSSGPFDWHLTHKLIDLCAKYRIEHSRDIFRYYRSDAAAAVEAGNDIRTALLCFALDASHGYERTHVDSLTRLAGLLALYIQSGPVVARDQQELGPLEGLPEQPA
jgi:peptidase M42 family hydrolase